MDSATAESPAWVSKSRVNRAGQTLREVIEQRASISDEDAIVLDAWRAAHRYILNTFQALLRTRTKNTGIVVAQRLKRRSTILDKLLRESGMQLARMDDIAGCRLIFPDVNELSEFRARLHKGRFRHKKINDVYKYDYIESPKFSGYRGIHDIYKYDSRSKEGARHKGLLVEIQYRTKCQHAWATTVELVTDFTGNQPKFNRGDLKHIEFFKLASEIIARAHEDDVSCHSGMRDNEVAERFSSIDTEIHLMTFLRQLRPSENVASEGALILHIGNGDLRIHEYNDEDEAMGAYFDLEKQFPRDNIVLVNADTFAAIRAAYPNYFSDVVEFVRLIDDGCGRLGNT